MISRPSVAVAIASGIVAALPATAAVAVPALASLRSGQDGNGSAIECAPLPSPYPTWEQLPRQSSLPDPFLPLWYTTPDNPADVMAGKGEGRVQTPEEWYQCRQPEIVQLLQEYQFGYYPDPAQETVEATRSGNTLSITVTGAEGKKGSFKATVTLPTGASASNPAPVVINIGGMSNQPYLAAGIAIAQFDYTTVSPDSNAKTGAFWSIYEGRDIGVLTAWAWGFHRTLDAINMTVPEIDAGRVGVTGCSRLGKAALAAGLFDTRITLTMPMSSGVQGLGPYRYYDLSGQGENLENSKQGAGWWTDSALGTFVGHAENLPFDAHTIAAAIAPRALVIDQGTGDQFTNSKGTAIAVYPAAKVVFDWLGVGDQIAMSVRGGGHCDMSGFTSILPFVQKIFFGTPTDRDYNDLGSYGSPMASAFPWATAVPSA
ncbi:carbohydrate esterase family 15 protein [Chaetomium sp. MPI-SDFR-AT-0129]|nr:carbohydrate esterase family 15 protein [Chaetomium sp. MPI-SDFR-AT-0129]